MGGITLTLVVAAALAGVVGVPMLASRRPRPGSQDPRVSAVLAALPGGNCGVCGNGSCFDAASAVAEGRAPDSVCVTGGSATAAAVREALAHSGATSRT